MATIRPGSPPRSYKHWQKRVLRTRCHFSRRGVSWLQLWPRLVRQSPSKCIMSVNWVNSFDRCDRGWQQSTINGSALLKWEDDLDFKSNPDPLLIGFINAAPWLSGSLMYVSSKFKWPEQSFKFALYTCSKQNCRGTWLSDPLQERFGRRPALFVAAVFCVVLVIGIKYLEIRLLWILIRTLSRDGSLWFMEVTTRLQGNPWCWRMLIFSDLLLDSSSQDLTHYHMSRSDRKLR